MIDYNCFIGNWPFHKTRNNKFSDILRMHKNTGVEYGYISKIESIFYNDPYESELELYNEIKGSGYKQVLTINPTLDICINTVKRAIEELKISGVRIMPGYHGYSINDECVKDLVKLLRKNNLPLFINVHLEDERVSYLIHPNPVPMDELKEFIKNNPDLEILLCTIGFNELVRIKEEVMNAKNLTFDTSGFKDRIFAMTYLREEGMDKKARFGSMAPIFAYESSYLIYTEED